MSDPGLEPTEPTETTVLAREAPALSIRRARLRENVVGTLWFIPLCFALGAAVLSRITLAVDRTTDLQTQVEVILPGDPTALATAASTVAAAMLTFVAVVFSTTLVAIQLAASQYSPRIVRIFVRSRLTHVALGVFLATFVFSLNALVGTREAEGSDVPSATMAVMYLLVLATVLTFIAFVHGMVRLLRVQYLLRLTARASHDAVDGAFPDAARYRAVPGPEPSATPRPVLPRTIEMSFRRGNPRVLEAVDVAGLAAAAARAGCWIELQVSVGEHVSPRTVVARVHGPDPTVLTDEQVHAHLLFGTERTLLQDPGFGFRQLVDIASRALSPAVNDPTTAVQALLRVEDLLVRVATRPDPSGWYLDAEGCARVRLVEPGFVRLATLGLVEILRYGGDSPQVVRALLAVCRDLAELTTGDRRASFEALGEQCRAVAESTLHPSFSTLASEPDRMGLG